MTYVRCYAGDLRILDRDCKSSIYVFERDLSHDTEQLGSSLLTPRYPCIEGVKNLDFVVTYRN